MPFCDRLILSLGLNLPIRYLCRREKRLGGRRVDKWALREVAGTSIVAT
jgi:hypothetical protein